jgi:2-dehydropantoate 2-reductase
MRIAVMGAGAVGTYYGVRLARAGHDVQFVARDVQADALRRSGIELRSPLGDDRLFPVNVTTDAATIRSSDLVLLTVKLWATEVAARAIRPIVGPGTAVVSLQNGIEKDDVIAGIVGREAVLGGVTYVFADRPRPGVVVHSGQTQRIVVGELGGGRSDRVDRVVAALVGAGIDGAASTDIRRELWEKLILLAANSAVTAGTRETIGAIRARAVTRALYREVMEEAAAVARAEGVQIAHDFVDDRMRFVDAMPAEGRASMAKDLLRGLPLELEWLSGAVVRRGKRAGVPTPVNRALFAALIPFAQGGKPAEGSG